MKWTCPENAFREGEECSEPGPRQVFTEHFLFPKIKNILRKSLTEAGDLPVEVLRFLRGQILRCYKSKLYSNSLFQY